MLCLIFASITQSDEDPDCDSFVSEPDLVSNDEQSTLEFTIERNNQLDLTGEPHDSLLEVFIICEESITESSVNRENPASTFANINSDSITLSVETNYAVLENVTEADPSDPEITFGAQQTVSDDS